MCRVIASRSARLSACVESTLRHLYRTVPSVASSSWSEASDPGGVYVVRIVRAAASCAGLRIPGWTTRRIGAPSNVKELITSDGIPSGCAALVRSRWKHGKTYPGVEVLAADHATL